MISSLGRWVLIVSLASGALTAVAGGCSADGSGGVADTDAGNGQSQPDSSGSGDDDSTAPDIDSAQPDAAKKDSGIKDSSIADTLDGTFTDGNPDTGSTGDKCSPNGQVEYQSCGMCGLQSRVCLPNDPTPDSGDAGGPVWQPWGFCTGGVPNGCQPGATNSVPCGLCGTQQQVCQNDCTWAVGSCTGQPANACAPDASDFEPGLSCDAGGRSRNCNLNCTWGNFSGCYIPSPPDGSLTGAAISISTTVGTTKSATFTMPPAQTMNVLEAFTLCPTNIVNNMATSYVYVQVFNPAPQTATVSIWTAPAPGQLDIDTLLVAYKMQTPPATDSQRQQCNWPATGTSSLFDLDTCNDTSGSNPKSCQRSFGGLMIGDKSAVTIGPYSTIVVYAGSNYNAANPPFADAGINGQFVFAVRTESLQ
jgi:hypothetical protein